MKRTVNFKLIGLSLIFLANPNIAVFDLLPDFIGYALLCAAIVRLSDINDYLNDAYILFRRLAFIDAAKVVAIIWIFGIATVNERGSSLLLWSFAFGVLELIFAYPAFIKLYGGLTALSYVHPSTVVLQSSGRSKKNRTEKMLSSTLVFITCREVLTVLPELSNLSTTNDFANTGNNNLYRYIGLLRGFAVIPVLILGCVFAYKAVRYFTRVANDAEFVNSINAYYSEKVTVREGLFIKRDVSLYLTLLVTATALNTDIRIESVNIFPDFLASVTLLLGALLISRRIRINKKLFIVLCATSFAASLIAWGFELEFFADYYYGAVYRSEAAYVSYLKMATASVVSSVLFFASGVASVVNLYKIIDVHTGSVSLNDPMHEKMNVESRRELKRYPLCCILSLLLGTVTDVLYTILVKDHGIFAFVATIGSAICIIAFTVSYFSIRQAVNSRYIFE